MKLRRLAKRIGLATCTLIIVTWAVSMRWSFGFDSSPRVSAAIESGMFIALWSDGPAAGFGWILERAESRRLSPLVELNPSEYSAAFIPLWLPLVVLAVPLVWLCWADRTRTGFCACGYDLTGNVSGVCPECGKTI